MIKSILNKLVKNHIFANLIVLFILAGGFASYKMLFRELEPGVADRYVKVDVNYTGVDPQEVDESISQKLNNSLTGLAGVKRIRSYSFEGGTTLKIFPLDGYSINDLKDEVEANVDGLTFPDGADKPIIKKQKWTPEVCAYMISGNVPEHQLRRVAIEIKDDLLKLPAVNSIDVWGAKTPVISIEISEKRLLKYGLTFDKIKDAITKNGLNVSAGSIKTKVEDIRIKAIGRKYQAKDYRNIPVKTKPDGSTVKLGQVAKISDTFDKDEDYYFISENNCPSIMLMIRRGENDDSMVTAKEVASYIKKVQKTLPDSIKITKFFDTTSYVDSLLKSFSSNGLVGLFLVILLLWMFLDFRLSIWVAMGIPVSLAGAMIIMSLTGITLNFFSLFGLIMVVGIIVDDGIVVGETIFERQINGESSVESVVNGTAHVAWPVVAAVLTTIISFIPLLFMTGMMRDFIKPIPIVVISALAFSLVEALIVLPVHLRNIKFSNELPKNKYIRFFTRMRLQVNNGLTYCVNKIYSPLIVRVLKWRYTTLAVGVFVVFVVVGLIAGGNIKFKFFPRTDSDMIKSNVQLPAGNPTAVSKKIALKYYDAWKKVEKKFKTPDGKNPAEGFYAVIQGDSIDFFVPLVPMEQRHIPYLELANAWDKNLGKIPEVTKSEFRGMGGFEGTDIELNLYGDNQNRLLEAANQLVKKIKSYKGTFDVSTNYEYGKRILTMQLKPAAYYVGLTLSEIAAQINSGFSGVEAMKIQRGKDEIAVELSYMDNRGLNSIKYFRNVRIKTADGKLIPLYDLVKLSLETAPSSINREDGMIYLRVYANVNDKVANAKEIQADLNTNYLPKLADRYDISYGQSGRSRQTGELFNRMLVAVPLALLGIYFILVLIFNSYFQPVIIMVTIPFGIIGAVIGLAIFGLDISLMGIFGTIALTGVVVNDAIVLINEVNVRLKSGAEFFTAVKEGAVRRVRAILLTTLTTFFGMMPLAFQQSFTAQTLKPMAVTIAFGILFTTIVTLILVPAFFVVLNDLKMLMHFIWNLKWPSRLELEAAAKSRKND